MAENPCSLNGVKLQQENNKFTDTQSMKYKFYHQIEVTSFAVVGQWFSINTFPPTHMYRLAIALGHHPELDSQPYC